ncbi:hypothetical protein SDC9_146018 [bioreactor metagenome]|uniref:Uncharacterized protein n=1 Tax=bioreactor metagenome TaxID=1076179 RepID=A0A645ECK3_9ZZZZ
MQNSVSDAETVIEAGATVTFVVDTFEQPFPELLDEHVNVKIPSDEVLKYTVVALDPETYGVVHAASVKRAVSGVQT